MSSPSPSWPGSLLWVANQVALSATPPSCFPDLNLDQIVDGICAGHPEPWLRELLYTPLTSIAAVDYRQRALRELERPELRAAADGFLAAMELVRQRQEQVARLRSDPQRWIWFLNSTTSYLEAVESLAARLEGLQLSSASWLGLRSYLRAYRASAAYQALLGDCALRRGDLDSIRYQLRIRGLRVTVSKGAGGEELAAAVSATLAKFEADSEPPPAAAGIRALQMNHVEEQILDLVVQLHPEVFSELASYQETYSAYLDPVVERLSRELLFATAYLNYLAPLQRAELPLCYPAVSEASDLAFEEAFDLALAQQLVAEGQPVVRNSLQMQPGERVLVITGPNQGGKTTFLRLLGQLHYLAALGGPVPGSSAEVLLADRVFTHFEVGEQTADLSGKLHDDLVRLARILSAATPRSLILLNEVFSSTALEDALFLGTKVLEQIGRIGALCAYVTFVDELTSLGLWTVSLVSALDPEQPLRRTFKILRRPADGRSLALSVAERHRITGDWILKRVAP